MGSLSLESIQDTSPGMSDCDRLHQPDLYNALGRDSRAFAWFSSLTNDRFNSAKRGGSVEPKSASPLRLAKTSAIVPSDLPCGVLTAVASDRETLLTVRTDGLTACMMDGSVDE